MKRGQKGQNKRLSHWQLKQSIDINKQKQEDLQIKLHKETKVKRDYENGLNRVADIIDYDGEDIDKLIEKTKKMKIAYLSTLEEVNATNAIINTKVKLPKDVDTLEKKVAYIVTENNWFKSKFIELSTILNIEIKSFQEIFEIIIERLQSKGKNIFSKLFEGTKELNRMSIKPTKIQEDNDSDFRTKKINTDKQIPFKRKRSEQR